MVCAGTTFVLTEHPHNAPPGANFTTMITTIVITSPMLLKPITIEWSPCGGHNTRIVGATTRTLHCDTLAEAVSEALSRILG